MVKWWLHRVLTEGETQSIFGVSWQEQSYLLMGIIPGTGEPGGLPSLGSHRVGHDWSDLAAAAASYMKMFFPGLSVSLPSLISCLEIYRGRGHPKRRYRFINKDVHHRPTCDSKSYTQPNCSTDRKRLRKIPFPPKDYFADIKNCAGRDHNDTRKCLKQI